MRARVVDFDAAQPRHAAAFRDINLGWIRELFRVEPHDEATLGDPAALVAAGGSILLAVDDAAGDAAVVGACALLAPAASGEPAGRELAKMGVEPAARGCGVGRLLGEAAVRRAREQGAAYVDILSNRRLGPALALYGSLGFVEAPMPPTDYERADIYLVLRLGGAGGQ